MGPLYCLYECMYVSVRKSEEEVGQLRKKKRVEKGGHKEQQLNDGRGRGAVAGKEVYQGKEEEKKEEKKKEEEK